MARKHELLANLRAVFDKWEHLLAGRTEEQIAARSRPSDWSIADVVAHLMAWQQVSIARVDAALHDRAPGYPEWLGGVDPFVAEESFDLYNARIWNTYRDQPWATVYRMWRDGFERFIELGEAIGETELLEAGRYTWLKEYPLASVLEGSWEHHDHHYQSLTTRLGPTGRQ